MQKGNAVEKGSLTKASTGARDAGFLTCHQGRSRARGCPAFGGKDGGEVDNTIGYLNTDLDLTSGDDLTALAAAFEAQGVFPLHVTHGEDGRWSATFETDEPDEQPEPQIAAMLAVIEALAEPLQTVWLGCTRREFNIGYDCGCNPWAFTQGLSSQLLGRMAAAGASLRITLYPPAREKTAAPDAAPDA